jgi:phage tail sheath protein FI
MSVDDITNGRLVVEIGISPTRPAEFVIFRISQLTASATTN